MKGTLTMSDDDFIGFSDDLDGVIPDSLKDNTYLSELAKCEHTTGHDGRRWLVLKWEVIEEGDFFGEEIGPEMYQVFSKEDFENATPDEQKKLKKVRRNRIARLESLGVPRDRLKEFKPEDLQGLQAYVTVLVRPNQNGPGQSHWIKEVVLETSVKTSIPNF